MTATSFRAAVFQYRSRDEAPGDRLSRLDKALTKDAGQLDLIVCPELFMSGYADAERVRAAAEPADGPFARAVAGLAEKHRVAIVYGYPERDHDRLYNSARCAAADGRLIANHRKRCLPPGYERSLFDTGGSTTMFEISGHRIALVICYEIEFPEAARQAALAGAHILVAPTALTAGWAVVARRVVPSRAFENGLFVIYANYAGREGDCRYLGDSRIVGPLGEDLAVAGTGEEIIGADIDIGRIAPVRTRLPFLVDRSLLGTVGE